MKLGMQLAYAGGFVETVSQVRDLESAGLDMVMVPEAYTFDAVSQLGYLAASTTRVQIASGILNVFSRTPSLLAMTAAGLDYVSDGRFVLGLGASGPQVVEGFHGVPYDAPLGRTGEVVEICRQVWRREPVAHDGKYFQLPLGAERGGSGLGKPLKLINHPVRPRIPIFLAALGPKNIALAAELFEGWEPLFYYPERALDAFGEALAAGSALRSPELPALEVYADTHLLITDETAAQEAGLRKVREHLALYVGGMGAKGKNFYNDLAKRYGFAEEAEAVQDLYLGGDKSAAAAAVPDELVRGVSLIGDEAYVKDRVAAFAEAGATQLNVLSLRDDHPGRVADLEALRAVLS